MRRAVLLACLVLTLTLLAASCAITSGSTFSGVISAELAASRSGSGDGSGDVPPPADPSYRLRVETRPSGADVWIDNTRLGTSPVEIDDLPGGTYRLRVERDGYYPLREWITVPTDTGLLLVLDLKQITGFLRLEVTPQDAELVVGSEGVDSFSELPVGRYPVRVSRFGYEPYRGEVVIVADGLTTLRVDLEPAEFRVESFRVARNRFNPANPGATGSVQAAYRVSAPGRGSVVVRDAEGAEVAVLLEERYDTWDQTARWDGRDRFGRTVADGPYLLVLTAEGDDGRVESRTASVVVDRSLVIRYRSVWSAAPGLLYSPTRSALPPGRFQLGLQAAGIISVVDDSLAARFPGRLGLRAGLGSGFELFLHGGVTAHSDPIADRWSAGGSIAWDGFDVSLGGGTLGFGLAAGGEYESPSADGRYAGPDTRASFSGLFVSVPVSFGVGPLSLVTAGELRLTPAEVTYGPVLPENSLGAIGYLKAGALLDLGTLTVGASAALRSGRLGSGLALDLPFQAGVEVHWLLPGTSVGLTGFAAAEIESAADFYIMSGIGLGFLF